MKFYFQNIQFILALLVVILFSCEIESVKPSKRRELVIASDYLTPSDTIIFQNFSKQKNIKVKILNLSPSKIIGEFRNKNFSTGIDIIMLKSMTDVLDFSKKEVLHPLKKGVHFSEIQSDYSSEKYNYVGFGYDPFIVAIQQNGPRTIRMYNDLTRHKFSTDLSNKEMIPMLAPILEKMKKAEANRWVKKFVLSSKRDTIYSDSIIQSLPILTNFSTFKNQNNKNQFKDRDCIFPNTKSTGTFYNLRTFTIAIQAENFEEALTFVHYFSESNANSFINRELNTIGIKSNEVGFRKYYYRTEEMMSYYLTAERLLNKLSDN